MNKLLRRHIVGITIASISVITAMGFILPTLSEAASMSQMQTCIAHRREAGYYTKGLTLRDRRAIRLQFRLCLLGRGDFMNSSSMSSWIGAHSSSTSSNRMSSSSWMGASSSYSWMSSSSDSSTSSRVGLSSSSSSVREHAAISIKNMAYEPTNLTVKKGTVVTWTNNDSTPHTVTANRGYVPDSGKISPGQTYSYTFDLTGTYTYTCGYHPMMRGTVNVIE